MKHNNLVKNQFSSINYCKINEKLIIHGGKQMTMTTLIIACIIIVVVITGLFLTAVNWGYKVKHTIDEVSHENNTTNMK